MIFLPTEVNGAHLIRMEPRQDDRGSFARAWCIDEFRAKGLEGEFVQANLARSHRRGTLRGMHYQAEPHAEAKLVRCTRGGIWDVVLDLRPGSPTYRRWYGVELTPDRDEMLYVPPGCAHGYQALSDDTEVFYLVSARYAPEAERGVRYDDPAFRIAWAAPVTEISDKDRRWPDHVDAPTVAIHPESHR